MKKDANYISLRDYFETRFASSEKEVAAALSAAKEAVLKAENANEKRFEGVNEFRNTLSDQQRTLMPRTEVELMMKNISDRVKALEDKSIEKGGEVKGVNQIWVLILGATNLVSFAISLFAYFHTR